ncbi:MAG TPA: hypothetical protein VGD69_22475 [Herpetosiphonaceae bacterium]
MSRIIRRQGLIIIHIVLTLLTLSACASSAPAAIETPEVVATPEIQATQDARATEGQASEDRLRLARTECQELQTALAQQLATEISQTEGPLPHQLAGHAGISCTFTAKGTGKEFGSFLDVADKIRATLNERGWIERGQSRADGPTGTQAEFNKSTSTAIINVSWQPAPEVQCPADQPISACEVAPEQQIFNIELRLSL